MGINNLIDRIISGTVLLIAAMSFSAWAQKLVVESISGPVTAAEISAFKSAIQSLKPAASNLGNAYVYGATGTQAEAFGTMFIITKDVAFLDKMIEFADAMLFGRNDAVTGRVLRTGKRELAWPNKTATAADATYTGSENGDVVGHIAFCAKLILSTPALWDKQAPADTHDYGKTYKERALKYVFELERTMDTFLVPFMVKKDLLLFYDAGTTPIPWNQVTMMSNGFQRLAECHQILGDAPEKQAFYYSVVKSSYEKFQKMVVPSMVSGHQVFNWAYPQNENPVKHTEDLGHSNYDIIGVWRAFQNPATAPPRAFVQGFANTLQYVIHKGNGQFSSRVDGTNNAGESNHDNTYAGWLYMMEFIPDFYATAANADLARAKSSADFASILFWEKNLRAGGLNAIKTQSGPSRIAPMNAGPGIPFFDAAGRRILMVQKRNGNTIGFPKLISTERNRE
jgi:hypothetical protein